MAAATRHTHHRLLDALHQLGDSVSGQLVSAEAQLAAVALAKGVQGAIQRHQGRVVVAAGHPTHRPAHCHLLWCGGVALLPKADLALCIIAPHEQPATLC